MVGVPNKGATMVQGWRSTDIVCQQIDEYRSYKKLDNDDEN